MARRTTRKGASCRERSTQSGHRFSGESPIIRSSLKLLIAVSFGRRNRARSLRKGQPLFQSINSFGTTVTGRTPNRHNAWAAIRKRAKKGRFSHADWISHLASNRHHDLSGE
jgi:hypothetical protein